jgi:hypothetical protein
MGRLCQVHVVSRTAGLAARSRLVADNVRLVIITYVGDWALAAARRAPYAHTLPVPERVDVEVVQHLRIRGK